VFTNLVSFLVTISLFSMKKFEINVVKVCETQRLKLLDHTPIHLRPFTCIYTQDPSDSFQTFWGCTSMGEIRNTGNIKIGKYRIRFWNCEIDINKYCIENISVRSVELIQHQDYWKIMIQYFVIQNSVSVVSRKYQIILVLSFVVRLIPIIYPFYKFLTVK
jgi:hypothetical protein